ncbi:MAG: HvfC/BufC family peptide modification chaperone [Steroidobacteraceae bacterium]
MSLLETQRALRAALVAGSDAPLDPLCVAVYRNTFRQTLVRALSLAFPAVERLVGAAFFEAAALGFIEHDLPASACLNDYGGEFPDFLGGFAPAATLPYLPDVARLEWAVDVALHAPDAAALDLARLAGLAHDRLERVRLIAHPALTLLALPCPADEIWNAVIHRDEAAMGAIDLASGPAHLLIERGSAGVQVQRLSPVAWAFTRGLVTGASLAEALSAAAPATHPMLYAVLTDHLASGRFIDFEDRDP